MVVALACNKIFLRMFKALPINITKHKLITYAAGSAAQSCTAATQALNTSKLDGVLQSHAWLSSHLQVVSAR